jgi:3-oxoacyl-[acyl-carrier protein] reductase
VAAPRFQRRPRPQAAYHWQVTQRRVRRRQGHPAFHHGIRPGRIKPRRPGITFTTVLPQFAPLTGVGRSAVAAYAAQAGLSVKDFLSTQTYPLLTPEIAGAAIVELVQAEAANVALGYVLNGGGLQQLP